MPTLKEYVPSSAKSGVYILANVGAPTPVTLQTSPLARKILRAVDYHPGDNIPTRLVWSMYDVGLLTTSRSSQNVSNQLHTDTAAVLDDLELGNVLSPMERNRLVRLLDDYTGPNKNQIEQLSEQLESSSSLGTHVETMLKDGTVYPSTAGEATSNLFVWSEGLDDWKHKKRGFKRNRSANLLSLQVFYGHPYVDFSEIRFLSEGGVQYRLTDTGLGCEVLVTDRRYMDGAEYVLTFEFDSTPNGQVCVRSREITETSDMDDRLEDWNLKEIVEVLLPLEEKEVDQEDAFEEFEIRESTSLPVVGDIEQYCEGTNERDSGEFVDVVVDRISTQGNPVAIFPSESEQILTVGEPGDRLIVRRDERIPKIPCAILQ